MLFGIKYEPAFSLGSCLFTGMKAELPCLSRSAATATVTTSTLPARQVAVCERTLQTASREHRRQLAARDSQLTALREELGHVRQQHQLDRQRTVGDVRCKVWAGWCKVWVG